MKLSTLSPVLLLTVGTLSACGGGSKSPDPTPVKDTVAPVITLNGESSLILSAGTAYSDLGATANDAIDGSVTVTTTGNVNSNVVSSYTLTYTASDAAGNQSSLTRTVNVVDDIAPAITLEGDSELTHSAGTDYSDAGATATDATDGSVDVVTTGTVDSATVGSYTLTYTATDAAGNIATATRTVKVVDDVAPVLVLNGVTPFAHNAGDVYADMSVSVTDNVDEASAITITATGAVNADVIGSYTVTYTATDAAGNEATAVVRTVNVVDEVAPVITLNGAATVNVPVGGTYTEENATALDAYDGDVLVTITGSVELAPATYTITYTATDKSENSSTLTRSVIIAPDNTPNVFALTARDNAFLSTEIESNSVTVAGVNTEIAVSITDGEYSINDAPYTADDGTISAGQRITIKHTTANTLSTDSETTLTLGSLTETFTTTTRSAEPSGIFTGTGTVNSGVNLTDIKGMVYQEHFIFFNEAANVLYDGTITDYNATDFTASVDVYKDGVIDSTVAATGTISNQATIALTLTGTGYGAGTIDMAYFLDAALDPYYERDATEARYSTAAVTAWYADDGANTTTQVHDLVVWEGDDSTDFKSNTEGGRSCSYDGTKHSPDVTSNIYQMSFDVTHLNFLENCDQVGTGFTGVMTIVDGDGGVGARINDGTMWFAATNGQFSTFGVLVYFN